jgi:isopenicillin N synthase-like dioxygenase
MNTRIIRCGEHTDYGSMTLLFQDDVGGLEVSDRSGHFVPVDTCVYRILFDDIFNDEICV